MEELVAGALSTALAGRGSQGRSVPSLVEAAGAGGGLTRFGYRADGSAIPSRPVRVVARFDALRAGAYLDVAPARSAANFRGEAFGPSVRGDRTVLARSQLAAGHVDPSKRNARLDAVDGWDRRLAPGASVDRVTVVEEGRLVRVTGVVDTSALEFA